MTGTIRADRKALLAAVEPCAKAAASNSTLALLQCLKFETSAEGILITGSDSRIQVQRTCPTLIVDDVSFCVRADLIRATLTALPDGDVAIQANDSEIKVTCGKGKFKLPILSAEDYALMEPKGEVSEFRITASALSSIASVENACADRHETSRPLLQCVNISREGDRLVGATTNTHMAMKVLFDGDIESGKDINIHPSMIANIGAMGFGEAEELCLEVFQNLVRFDSRFGSVSRSIEWGDFPNWRRVFPESHTKAWRFVASEAANAISSLAMMANDSSNKITLTQEEDCIRVHASSVQFGEGESTFPVVTDGSPNGFAFACNYRYLLDCLKQWGDAGMTIAMTEHHRPVTITTDALPDWTALIMPMALN